jgi:hypothetical protein
MAEDQPKVLLIAQFLADSFAGCSIFYDDPVARSYRIVDESTGKLLHQAIVSRAFLKDHAEAEIVPALQSLAFLACLKIAGTRRVTVNSQRLEIEAAA